MLESIGLQVPGGCVHAGVFGKVMLQQPMDANDLQCLRAAFGGEAEFSGRRGHELELLETTEQERG